MLTVISRKREKIGLLIVIIWRCPRGVMVNQLDSGIVVSEFELEARYCVHFRTNNLGKCMNPLIFPAMGQIASLPFF